MSPIQRKSEKEDSGMADKDPGYSPFVQAVAGDGTSPPDVRVLTGWLGASGEEGHVRLYLDATLSAYVDIPRDAVLYSEEIPNSHPAGQRSVWVKNDAELKEGGSAIARAAKFLFGQVQQDFAQSAGDAQAQAPQTQICLTFKPGCQPSVANPCITRTEMPNCRFTRIPCSAIDACPSAMIECNQPTSPPCMPGPVTVRWPDCGSAVDACPTRICDFAPQVQEAAGPPLTAGFCVPRTQTFSCRPRTMTPCPTMLGCGLEAAAQPQLDQQFAQPQFAQQQAAFITAYCQPTAFCRVSAHGCGGGAQAFGQQSSEFCPTSGGCTGAIQGGGGFPSVGCGPHLTRDCSVVVCPQPSLIHCAQAFGQQSSEFCPTSGGCTGAVASGPGWTCNCPPPPPHTGHPAITCGPCTGFAANANVGWTSAGCGTHTFNHYGCTGHVPCATCTVCW